MKQLEIIDGDDYVFCNVRRGRVSEYETLCGNFGVAHLMYGLGIMESKVNFLH